jgi:hypothetical protein
MRMTVRQPRYSKEEFARRGDEIYETQVRPQVEAGNSGKIVAIDIETEDFEVDASEIAACDRLEARHPDTQIWIIRIGSRHVRRVFSMSELHYEVSGGVGSKGSNCCKTSGNLTSITGLSLSRSTSS